MLGVEVTGQSRSNANLCWACLWRTHFFTLIVYRQIKIQRGRIVLVTRPVSGVQPPTSSWAPSTTCLQDTHTEPVLTHNQDQMVNTARRRPGNFMKVTTTPLSSKPLSISKQLLNALLLLLTVEICSWTRHVKTSMCQGKEKPFKVWHKVKSCHQTNRL